MARRLLLMPRRLRGEKSRFGGATPRRATRLAVVASLAVASVLWGAGAASAATAPSGYGTMTVSPQSATAGQTLTQLTFSFLIGDNGHDYPAGSSISIAVPTGWTAPTMTAGAAGVTSATGTTSCQPSGVSVSGMTITIALANGCNGAGSGTTQITIRYGGGTSGSGVTPTVAGTNTFVTSSKSGGSAAANFTTSPTVTVNAGAASQLIFTSAPSGATQAGSTFANQPVVKAADANGNTVTTYTGAVALSAAGTGTPGSLTCSGPGGLTATASSGVATFSGCYMTGAGSYSLNATDGALKGTTSGTFTVTAAAPGRLALLQQPSNTVVNAVMSPGVKVQVQDSYGNPTSTSGTSITLTASGGVAFSGSLTASTDSTGTATFTLTPTHTAIGATLTGAATVSGTNISTGASTSFNVSVKVTTSANALSDSAADAGGSGVASVSYYYCTGFAATCPSTGRTLIGTSTTPGTFALAWTGQPSNGSYTVVAVATDNVGNVGATSPGTPVTVSN